MNQSHASALVCEEWREQLHQIREEIRNNRSVFVHGQRFVSAHSLVEYIMAAQYVPLYLSNLHIRNGGWDHLIGNYNHHNVAASLGSKKHCEKRVIVIDQLDNLHTMVDKTYLTNSLKKRDRYSILIILLGQQSESQKMFDELRRRCEVVVDLPNIDVERCEDIVRQLSQTYSCECLSIENTRSLLAITDSDLVQCESVIALTLIHMENEHDCARALMNLPASSNDLTVFDAFRRAIRLNILTSYGFSSQEKDIRVVYDLYKHNKVLLPLTLYENIMSTMHATIHKNRLLQGDRIVSTLQHTCECISFADLIETNIYSDQNWHIQFLHCVIGLLCPIMDVNSLVMSANQEAEGDGDPYEVHVADKLGYSAELNRASLKNINRKNIGNIDVQLDCNLEDYTMMNYVCNEISRTEDIAQATRLFRSEESSVKLYDMLVKIDKTNDRRVPTPSSIRRALQGITEESDRRRKPKR